MYKGSREPTHDVRTEKQKACEHRWDYLTVVGGWGAAGTFEVQCGNCDSYLYFDMADAMPVGSFMPLDLRQYLNDKANKYERRHAPRKAS